MFSMCPPDPHYILCHLALCPQSQILMDCLIGLSYLLASRSVYPWKMPAGAQEQRVGSGHLFPSLPSCFLNEGWLNPSSKMHSSYRATLFHSFTNFLIIGSVLPPCPLGFPQWTVPGCYTLPYWFTSTLLMLLKILPTL